MKKYSFLLLCATLVSVEVQAAAASSSNGSFGKSVSFGLESFSMGTSSQSVNASWRLAVIQEEAKSPKRSLRKLSKVHPSLAPDVIIAWQAEQDLEKSNPSMRITESDVLFYEDFKREVASELFAQTTNWQYTMGRQLLMEEADPRDLRQQEIKALSLQRSDAQVQEEKKTFAQKICVCFAARSKR